MIDSSRAVGARQDRARWLATVTAASDSAL